MWGPTSTASRPDSSRRPRSADADLVIAMSSAHRRETVTLVPGAVQRTFVLGELEHMLGQVDADEVTSMAGENASCGERLRATVALAKRYRTPGVDPAEDIVDPYGRPASVYATSFRADPGGPRAAGPAPDRRTASFGVGVSPGMRLERAAPVAACGPGCGGAGGAALVALVSVWGSSSAYLVMVRTAAGQARTSSSSGSCSARSRRSAGRGRHGVRASRGGLRPGRPWPPCWGFKPGTSCDDARPGKSW